MTYSPNIGSQSAIKKGFFEQMPPPSPSGISVAGVAPANSDYPDIVTDGSAGTLAALEAAISKTLYTWKFSKADGSGYLYLPFLS